jgi:hypothetical protein
MGKKKICFISVLAVGTMTLTGMASRVRLTGGIQSYLVPLFFVVVIIAMGAAFYIPYKRKKDLEQLALSCGLAFKPDAEDLPDIEELGIALFTNGRSRETKNLFILSGAGAENVYFFDYFYVTGSGKHRRTHSFTPALFELSESILPDFELRPENFLDQIGEMIGFKDIDIDSFPEFSKNYRLTGPDEAAVRAFFTPAIANQFELNPCWRVQASDDYLVVFKKAGLVSVSDYQAYMEEAKNLVAAIIRK